MLNSDSTYVVSSGLVTRRNQDGTIILMKMDESSFFYKIEGYAANIWNALETRKSLSALQDRFAAILPEMSDTLRPNISGLLNALLEKNLIVEVSGESSRFSDAPSQPKLDDRGGLDFGGLKEFNLEQIETQEFDKSTYKDVYQDVYLDVFAGSDLRLKKDILPIEGALAKVTQLNGIKYKWNLETAATDDQSEHAGLIAQEVAAVMPEVVRRNAEGGHLAVEYSKIGSYLVEAIKDLNGIVKQQEARITELQERLDRNQSR